MRKRPYEEIPNFPMGVEIQYFFDIEDYRGYWVDFSCGDPECASIVDEVVAAAYSKVEDVNSPFWMIGARPGGGDELLGIDLHLLLIRALGENYKDYIAANSDEHGRVC